MLTPGESVFTSQKQLGVVRKWCHTILRKKYPPFSPFVTFRHAVLDFPSNMTSQTSTPLDSLVKPIDHEFQTQDQFSMLFDTFATGMGHGRLCRGPWVGTPVAIGLHHSLSLAPCVLHHGVLYSILALWSTIPWPGVAADAMCVKSQNLSPPSPSSHIVTISWTSPCPQCITSFMNDPLRALPKRSAPKSLLAPEGQGPHLTHCVTGPHRNEFVKKFKQREQMWLTDRQTDRSRNGEMCKNR